MSVLGIRLRPDFEIDFGTLAKVLRGEPTWAMIEGAINSFWNSLNPDPFASGPDPLESVAYTVLMYQPNDKRTPTSRWFDDTSRVSANRVCEVKFQRDGNMVIYGKQGDRRVIDAGDRHYSRDCQLSHWFSGCKYHKYEFRLQPDGNGVLYAYSDREGWVDALMKSGEKPGTEMVVLQGDCHLILRGHGNVPLHTYMGRGFDRCRDLDEKPKGCWF
eukprot:TRINITY_DN42601_c0_g1_i1.p1 TRINITY_DN42601_c0_g1~~TRINITY_DN42601_c0_g1_i1.p1  ORF type:complete len:254 (+),score=29.43 TRINITY_DN42601_c0_g1_i1:117-764(+)